MARSSSRRPRLPLWALVLVFAIGWIYNQYVARRAPQPPPQQAPSPRRSTPRPTRTPKPPDEPLNLPEYSPSAPSGPTPREIEGTLKRDRVVRVSDGDTIKLQRAGSIRLIGVDCPEKAQPGGQDAKNFTTAALMNKTVEYELCAKQPTDRYGRGLGFIYISDRAGRRVLFNAELVRQGYARVYSLRPCTVDEGLWNSYYEEARGARRGLFATLGDVPDAASYRRQLRAR